MSNRQRPKRKMLKPQGYAFMELDGKVTEWDTFTCNHCQKVVPYQTRGEAEQFGGHCLVCDKMICAQCVGKGCKPFEEKIRAQETRAANRREYEKVSGS